MYACFPIYNFSYFIYEKLLILKLQVNRHCKRMNKNRVTANRVTSEALNFFLEIHGDIDNLKISSTDREKGYAKRTLEDAELIYNNIVDKLGIAPTRIAATKHYRRAFWYNDTISNMPVTEPMSNVLDSTYDKVQDLYEKHQNMWEVDGDQVMDESDDSDTDSDSANQSDSDMENDVFQGHM